MSTHTASVPAGPRRSATPVPYPESTASPEPLSAVRRWGRRTARATGRSVYPLVAFPAGVAGLLAGPSGRVGRVGRLQRAAARRLLGAPVAAPPAAGAAPGAAPAEAGRVLRHSLASLPANLFSFAVLAPFWVLFLARGVLYPVFGADNLDQSWGGPGLAGAWLAHFIQGPPALLALTLVLWPVSSLQARLARRHLGS